MSTFGASVLNFASTTVYLIWVQVDVNRPNAAFAFCEIKSGANVEFLIAHSRNVWRRRYELPTRGIA
jgi:hypothetical protein